MHVVSEVYPGADLSIAPDMIVGYGDGHGASLATVLGQMPRCIISDNLDRWSGTHLTAPQIVPGMIVTNRRINRADPSISDIAPTILAEFGIETPGSMTGRKLFGRSG
jgi:predicted AlkP superfamily phosphohydrolase/phosphomutase